MLDEYGNDIELMKQYGQVDFEETESHKYNCKCADCQDDRRLENMAEQVDRFQPMAIVQKLDAMRETMQDKEGMFDERFVEGIKFALIWARVEVMGMALDPMRFKE